MREIEGYRETIAALDQSYPGQLMFSVADAARICGCSTDTVRRHVPMHPEIRRISRDALARWICRRR